jgi:hypothetical protein
MSIPSARVFACDGDFGPFPGFYIKAPKVLHFPAQSATSKANNFIIHLYYNKIQKKFFLKFKPKIF